MSKNKYFIRQYFFEQFFHGGIGCTDIETILSRLHYTAIELPHYKKFTVFAKIARLLYVARFFLKWKAGDTLVFIYPVFAKMNQLILRLAAKKKLHIICIVADIDGIKDGIDQLLEENISELKRYKNFIVHNDAMRQWLTSFMQPHAVTTLEFFDFLVKPTESNRQKTTDIVFAGNLDKSPFIQDLHAVVQRSPSLHFNLYGAGYTPAMILQTGVSYKGVFNPYELPSTLEGSFGLVWDGLSVDGPGGSFGNYMRFITHHKVSLYIVSGLPLIVPEMAGSAPLVKRYGIGITVNNLFELEDSINRITDAQYEEMRNNLKPLAQRIRSGLCLETALTELLKSIGDD
jgi:hypothetical protein